ncbi:MAG TPA: hypothetical protein VJ824_16035 [Bacillota bacterium]|nr:hypothetical protein [Bacillota bacterium]
MNSHINLAEINYIIQAMSKLRSYANITERFILDSNFIEVKSGMLSINGKKEMPYSMPKLKNMHILNVFPHISRSSLFITIVSAFEKCLYELSDFISVHKKIPYNHKKHSHLSLFERIEMYLKDEVGAVLSAGKEREKIINFNLIRNCLVHNNGDIWDKTEGDKREKLINAINKNELISYSLMDIINEVLSEQQVQLEPTLIIPDQDAQRFFFLKGFCFQVLDTYESYLKSLFDLNKDL